MAGLTLQLITFLKPVQLRYDTGTSIRYCNNEGGETQHLHHCCWSIPCRRGRPRKSSHFGRRYYRRKESRSGRENYHCGRSNPCSERTRRGNAFGYAFHSSIGFSFHRSFGCAYTCNWPKHNSGRKFCCASHFWYGGSSGHAVVIANMGHLIVNNLSCPCIKLIERLIFEQPTTKI
jgi:hypothetical protein